MFCGAECPEISTQFGVQTLKTNGCTGVVKMNLEVAPPFGNLGEVTRAGEPAGAQLHRPH